MVVSSLVLGILGVIQSIFLVGNVLLILGLHVSGLIDMSVAYQTNPYFGVFGVIIILLFFLGVICDILAVLFGILAIRKNTPNKQLAQTGLVLGIVSFSLLVITVFVFAG